MEKSGNDEFLALAENIRRLRLDVGFLSRVVRQFRNIAIAAHIEKERGEVIYQSNLEIRRVDRNRL